LEKRENRAGKPRMKRGTTEEGIPVGWAEVSY
jgi:hypothetical protein